MMMKLARRGLFQGIAGVLLGRVVAPEPVKAAVMAIARETDNVWHAAALNAPLTVYATVQTVYALAKEADELAAELRRRAK
jgi:hypothetical protein